ncbi:hypothetical protein CGRA01v4_13306 [Colletotrichum graminicola]|nr:hypothetical protein CGRA01v4_13306 [Colletotrichum graminicola]
MRLGFPALCTPGLQLVPLVSRWRDHEEASLPVPYAAVTFSPQRQRLRMARLSLGLGGLRSGTVASSWEREASSVA